ncbi:hypothetical protein PHYSODRAFT_299706 [Phytophthora sojae]|uniref:Uncharacterized protein n=1 Tax=Phytophthora sojae (strain P6497) TaxID=1094619 RepID=G4Z5Q9_PHYSP|nr:hypothetical protein PHYSODRAFT_299706 [Phytophthora sojae]EGZ22373.1 hypothetical protein PHYSODRAFT_299706 [Phytophthora sojae]|eukprot:XP_009525090.1 hypothetical protein PHYSODRAFT_299706 [Phytophthora sojae]
MSALSESGGVVVREDSTNIVLGLADVSTTTILSVEPNVPFRATQPILRRQLRCGKIVRVNGNGHRMWTPTFYSSTTLRTETQLHLERLTRGQPLVLYLREARCEKLVITKETLQPLAGSAAAVGSLLQYRWRRVCRRADLRPSQLVDSSGPAGTEECAVGGEYRQRYAHLQPKILTSRCGGAHVVARSCSSAAWRAVAGVVNCYLKVFFNQKRTPFAFALSTLGKTVSLDPSDSTCFPATGNVRSILRSTAARREIGSSIPKVEGPELEDRNWRSLKLQLSLLLGIISHRPPFTLLASSRRAFADLPWVCQSLARSGACSLVFDWLGALELSYCAHMESRPAWILRHSACKTGGESPARPIIAGDELNTVHVRRLQVGVQPSTRAPMPDPRVSRTQLVDILAMAAATCVGIDTRRVGLPLCVVHTLLDLLPHNANGARMSFQHRWARATSFAGGIPGGDSLHAVACCL